MFWMSVLTEMRNRGVRCVFFLACDGLKDFPKVVGKRLTVLADLVVGCAARRGGASR